MGLTHSFPGHRALLVAGVAALAVACSGGQASPTVPVSLETGALHIAASASQFSTASLTATAGKSFQIAFENREPVLHNVTIAADKGFATKILSEAPFNGPRTVVYRVEALAAGTYHYRCDVHPLMEGILLVGP